MLGLQPLLQPWISVAVGSCNHSPLLRGVAVAMNQAEPYRSFGGNTHTAAPRGGRGGISKTRAFQADFAYPGGPNRGLTDQMMREPMKSHTSISLMDQLIQEEIEARSAREAGLREGIGSSFVEPTGLEVTPQGGQPLPRILQVCKVRPSRHQSKPLTTSLLWERS